MRWRIWNAPRSAGKATPSVIAYGDATFPKGTASVVATRFPAQSKGVPLGELAANEVSRLRGYSLPVNRCTPPREKVNRENPQIFPIYI